MSVGPPSLLRRGPVPPEALVLAAIVSVQFGGALAATLIPLIGVTGSVAMRLGIACAILLLVARPSVRGRTRRDWATVIAFGLALAAMNTTFYASLTRLPIGVAVTIEFLGPLVLAASLSRHLRDAVAVLAAAVGVALISHAFTTPWAELDLLGIGLALAAGACWAAYIVLSGATGARFAQVDGLAIAMVVASVAVVPVGIAQHGSSLLAPEALAKGVGIALLSSVIPYSLELLALRRMTARVFGILLSLEPAFAALAGFLVLHQHLSITQMAGMALVVAASTAVTLGAATPVD